MPKIFILADSLGEGGFRATALAEDGVGVVEHLCSSIMWVKRDMGLVGFNHHREYEEHYPDGFQLVDYSDVPDVVMESDPLFMQAMAVNQKMYTTHE